MELFAVTTVVAIENGKKAFFWEAPWLDGIRPEDIAPLFSNARKRRRASLAKL
jgi:hypothetical protein